MIHIGIILVLMMMQVVAIKVVEADDADDVLKEIQILKTAMSPKIVRYYGSCMGIKTTFSFSL